MVNFALIRPMFGGTLTQSQVDGINAIIAAHARWGRKDNINDLAYALATAWWETGQAMQPVYERGSKAYFAKYEPSTKRGKTLGNTLAGDGYRYRGTGLVQLTGRHNFGVWAKRLGVDLLAHPELAMQPDIAARILVEGMKLGSFTGKGLAAYIDDIDESDEEDRREYLNARRIVNGTDRDDEIADAAIKFERALRAPGTVPQSPQRAPLPPDVPVMPTLPSPAPGPNKVRTTSVLAAILLPILYGILKFFGWAP